MFISAFLLINVSRTITEKKYFSIRSTLLRTRSDKQIETFFTYILFKEGHKATSKVNVSSNVYFRFSSNKRIENNYGEEILLNTLHSVSHSK